MPKINVEDASKFAQIKINNKSLSKITKFKAIIAPGKKRPEVSEDEHKDLIVEKYNKASNLDNHVTLFRVQDKKNLPHKEINKHTVPGPIWTPPSSVGFVMGALSKSNRVWSATQPTNDQNGLLGKIMSPLFSQENQ